MTLALLMALGAAGGALVGLGVIRMHRPLDVIAALVLLVAYLVSLWNLPLESTPARVILGAVIGYGTVTLWLSVAVEYPQWQERRRRINAADLAARAREAQQF